jgi:uncharacterized membrane protein
MVRVALQATTQASFKRWLTHACYLPWITRRYFNEDAQRQIELAVEQAELRQPGEIQVIIEGSLPLLSAYYQDTPQRALSLFGKYHVWDTAYNSGILLYINLCAHRVELLADRGIDEFVEHSHWKAICETVGQSINTPQRVAGVVQGIQQIGQTLQAFYKAQLQDPGNELTNEPVLI